MVSINGSLYLSGAMQHATDGTLGSQWRADCSKRLTELNFTPLDITSMDVEYNEIHSPDMKCSLRDDVSDQDKLQTKSNIRQHFIRADLELIQRYSDAVIILYDAGVRKGAGTISECQFAYDHDIPIFLVNSYPNVSEIPGWLFGLTTKVFSNWDELYQYLAALPPGILKKDLYGNRGVDGKYLCSMCGVVEEKHGAHFVSKISPLYCKSCVELVKNTHEAHFDRYEFFVNRLNNT